MLLKGINHVATLTNDSDRLHAFYREVFDAEVALRHERGARGPGFRLSFVDIGDGTMLNVFQIDGNEEALRQVPMFERGRIDHIGLRAKDLEAFETIRDRLMARGAADAFVTDFGSAPLAVLHRPGRPRRRSPRRQPGRRTRGPPPAGHAGRPLRHDGMIAADR